MKKLVIISHTEHYLNQDNGICGLAPTVNEINHLSKHWDEILHVACLYTTVSPPKNVLPYKDNVRLIAIPPFGGKYLLDKIIIIFKLPIISYKIVASLRQASEVQLRLPTSIGVFLVPLFSFFLPRKYTLWIKYAGNWGQKSPPLAYRFQRWWLKKNYARCKVTINGNWPNQAPHLLSFENPCLTEEELKNGITCFKNKEFVPPFVFSFVGRIDSSKGVDVLVKTLKEVPLAYIQRVHFVGTSAELEWYQKQFSFLHDKVVFHGAVEREKVHQLLQESHFLLLPSQSEGFPKVIAEAGCYGAIPIVSNVGSIPHYITAANGFLWDISGPQTYGELCNTILKLKENDLKNIAENMLNLANDFSYDKYTDKLKKTIIL